MALPPSILFSSVLLRHLDRLAVSGANVLISGETGTGKEVIARKIRERSGRRGRFIAINCCAFSENLVEANTGRTGIAGGDL